MYLERARLNFIWSISLPCLLLNSLRKSFWMLSHISCPLLLRWRQRDSKIHRSSAGQVSLRVGGTSSPWQFWCSSAGSGCEFTVDFLRLVFFTRLLTPVAPGRLRGESLGARSVPAVECSDFISALLELSRRGRRTFEFLGGSCRSDAESGLLRSSSRECGSMGMGGLPRRSMLFWFGIGPMSR